MTVLLNFKRTFWVPCDLFLHPYAGQSWLSPIGRVTDLTERVFSVTAALLELLTTRAGGYGLKFISQYNLKHVR